MTDPIYIYRFRILVVLYQLHSQSNVLRPLQCEFPKYILEDNPMQVSKGVLWTYKKEPIQFTAGATTVV